LISTLSKLKFLWRILFFLIFGVENSVFADGPPRQFSIAPNQSTVQNTTQFYVWDTADDGARTKTEKTLSFQDITFSDCKKTMDCQYSLTTLENLEFRGSDTFNIPGAVEMAGTVLYISNQTSVVMQKGLSLGCDTQEMFYAFPPGLYRKDHTFPSTLKVDGKLTLLQQKGMDSSVLEANETHIMLGDKGAFVIGKEMKNFLSGGWASFNSKIILYNSSLKIPTRFRSSKDTLDLLGSVNIYCPEILINSIIRLGSAEDYHASDLAASDNRTHIRFYGDTNLEKSTIVYTGAYDMGSDQVTFPKIEFSGPPNLSGAVIQFTVAIPITDLEKFRRRVAGRKWLILSIESRGEFKSLPKIECDELLKSYGIEGSLEKSKYGDRLYLVFK